MFAISANLLPGVESVLNLVGSVSWKKRQPENPNEGPKVARNRLWESILSELIAHREEHGCIASDSPVKRIQALTCELSYLWFLKTSP